jgi:hypothetical protein
MCVLVTKKDEHGNPVHAKILWFWVTKTYTNGRNTTVSHPWQHNQQSESWSLSPSNTTSSLNKGIVRTHSTIQSCLMMKSLLYAPIKDAHYPNQIRSGDSAKQFMECVDNPNWYEMFRSGMQICGLKPCPNSPSLFYGHPIPGKPPLYLAVYVDDFFYFSPDDTVERHFETTMQAQFRVDLFGTIKWFLGAYYDWSRENRYASVHLSQEAYSLQLISAHQISNATPEDKP